MRMILIISIFSGMVFGQAPTAAEILGKIRSHYQEMNDASASFTQTIQRRYKTGGQKISGTVKIKKGNKYRVESDQQTIVTDGKTVWMYTPKTKQVLIDRFKTGGGQLSPDKFLSGIPKDFSAHSVTKEGSTYILRLQLTPGNTTLANYSSVTVWTADNEWDIEKIELTEKNGTTTLFALSDIRFNKGIDDSVFQFRVSGDMRAVDINALQ